MTVRTDISLDKPYHGAAARLADLHPQTLCHYESQGNTRPYSPDDIERLRKITRLTQEPGVNLVNQQLEALRAELALWDASIKSAAARPGN